MPVHRGRSGAAGCGVLIGGTRRDLSSSTARARGQHGFADAQGHACGFPRAHRDREGVAGVAGAAPDQGCSSEATVTDPGWSLLRASGKESRGDWKESGGPTRGRESCRGASRGPGTGRAPLTRAAVREGAVKEVAAARPRLHGPAVRSPCVHGRVSRRPGPRGPA